MQLSIELQMLGWAMVLCLVQLLAASTSMTAVSYTHLTLPTIYSV